MIGDIGQEIRESGLPESSCQTIKRLLDAEGNDMLPLKLLRLIKFLNRLTSRSFQFQSVMYKSTLFENFLDLIKTKREGIIVPICSIYFQGEIPDKESKHVLPERFIQRLIELGKEEPVKRIKESIWGFLVRDENHLERFITLDQIIFGLWFENPITRYAILSFLLKTYENHAVLMETKIYMLRTGKGLSHNLLRRLLAICLEKKGIPKHDRMLLLEIVFNSYRLNGDTKAMWSDYLKNLNRFELIRLFSSVGNNESSEKKAQENRGQLRFSFIPEEDITTQRRSFHDRIMAIKRTMF